MTVDRAAAVGHGGTAGAIALHNALVAVALGDAGHVDLVAGSEGVSLDFVADVHFGSAVQLELLQVLLGGNASLLQVACLRLAELGFLHVAEAQLDGYVAVGLNGLLLSHDAGACFHNGNRDHLAALIEDLGHAHFFADDCFLHVWFSPLIRLLVDFCIGTKANMTRPPDARQCGQR